jgi:ABC-2 type transport system permease protein
MKEEHFTGTGRLLQFYLRRDRFILPIWILLPVFLIMGQISFTKAMPDWQMFLDELSESPVTVAILGPIVPLSIEGAIMWRGLVQASIAVMLGAALTMIRHTRTEETSGRNELILGRPVGRYANLTAALILSCGGSLLAGLLTVAVLLGNGFAESGSLVAGLTLIASGCIFGAYGLTMFAMILNNLGGSSSGWAWLAPEAWFRITVPFGENNVLPLLVFIVLSALPITLNKLMEYGMMKLAFQSIFLLFSS